MNRYLLSTYAIEGDVPGAPTSPEEMQTFMERVGAVEAEMDASGTFVFSGGLQLHGPNTATVVDVSKGEMTKRDGPFTESKTQIAGFYIINAENIEEALAWANKVADATRHPIEVRSFHATGHLNS